MPLGNPPAAPPGPQAQQPVAQAVPAAPPVQAPVQPEPAAPKASAQPAAQPSVAADASQAAQQSPEPSEPAGPEAAEEWTWTATAFYHALLTRSEAMRKASESGSESGKISNARQALDYARAQWYDQLPVLDICLNEDLKNWLKVPQALFVTIEKVPMVSDGNDQKKLRARVDVFAYMPNGDVHRYHPGVKRSDDAQVQIMQKGSPLFRLDSAAKDGVGTSLHKVPPGLASAPSRGSDGNHDESTVIAFNSEHLKLFFIYDMQRNGLRSLQEFVQKSDLFRGGSDIDITDGTLFPWWLAFAGNKLFKGVIKDGIYEVKAGIEGNSRPHLTVRSSNETVRVNFTSNGPKMHSGSWL